MLFFMSVFFPFGLFLNSKGLIKLLGQIFFKSNNINYIECPVMGGPGQAEEGILGGIVGGSDENFKLGEPYLKMFCKDLSLYIIFHVKKSFLL